MHQSKRPDSSEARSPWPERNWVDRGYSLASALLYLYLFLLGIKGLGDSFGLLGQDLIDDFFRSTQHPFLGLMTGIVTTSLVQSSSVTTSLIVALVAAPENPLPSPTRCR
jgi:hypothetical protein